MFRFQSPWWLALFLPLLALLLIRLRHGINGVVFSDLRRWDAVPRTLRQRLLFLPPCFLYAALTLLILALARPQAGREEYRVRRDGIAIAFCLDRSGSMQALDFQLDGRPITRLDAVKQTFRDFVLGNGVLPGRPDDMIAVLAFGGFVDTCCPLTLDHETLAALLDGIQLPEPLFDRQGRLLMPHLFQEESSTAIGDALAGAVERLRESSAKSKVILLLSDGEQTSGVLTPEEGAEVATAFGIKVYTIGIGSTGFAPFPVRIGGQVRYEQRHVALDETTLRQIAESTGGRYFNARNLGALEEVYAEIDRLEKTEQEGAVYTRYAELYRWFLIPAVLLLLLRWLLNTTLLRVMR